MKSNYKFGIIDLLVLSMVLVMIAFYNITPLVIFLQLLSFVTIIIYNAGHISLRKINKQYLLWWGLFIIYFGLSFFWSKYTSTYSTIMISIMQVAVVGFIILQYDYTCEKTDILLDTVIAASIVLTARLIIQVPFSAITNGRIGKYIGEAYGNDGAAMILCYGSLVSIIQSRRINRLIIILVIPFMVFALLTGTRLCIITFFIGALCIVFFSNYAFSTKIKTLFLTIIAFYILYRAIMEIPMFYKVIGYRIESLIQTLLGGVNQNKTYYDSSEKRILLIRYGIDIFKQYPIIGAGLDNYRFITPIKGYYSHNNFIEILADGGALGFVLYYWFPIYIIFLLIKKVKTNNQLVLPLSIVISIFISDIATISFNHEKTQLIYAISLCLVCTIGHNDIDNNLHTTQHSKYFKS